MNRLLQDENFKTQVSFLGRTLGPLFTEDPEKGAAAPVFLVIAELDTEEAAAEWPFVEKEVALTCLSAMRNSLSKGSMDEDLVWEYRRLFVGPARKITPPWGSVYTDRDMVIFGESTLALRRWMRQNGISQSRDENKPEDHIGLMLLLMGWMAENKPECLEEYLRLHLLTWSSHFLSQVASEAQHEFYRGLARLTDASLDGIREALEITVQYPRFFR
jgi:TorA maturation chaperone TorD